MRGMQEEPPLQMRVALALGRRSLIRIHFLMRVARFGSPPEKPPPAACSPPALVCCCLMACGVFAICLFVFFLHYFWDFGGEAS